MEVYSFEYKWLLMCHRDRTLLVTLQHNLIPCLNIYTPHRITTPHFVSFHVSQQRFCFGNTQYFTPILVRGLSIHRAPLLIWEPLLSLDNIITTWVGVICRSQFGLLVCVYFLMWGMLHPSFTRVTDRVPRRRRDWQEHEMGGTVYMRTVWTITTTS